MLTDTVEKQTNRVTKVRKHPSLSKQHQSDRCPSSEQSQLKCSLPTEKRMDALNLTKDQRKHQRFVKGLKTEIQVYLNQSVRESRFDSRGNLCLQMNPKRTTSALTSHRRNKIEPIVRSNSTYQQHSMELFRRNETKRLTADVQTILAGPVLKNFYTKFIQPQQRQQQPSPGIHLRLLEESMLHNDEQE